MEFISRFLEMNGPTASGQRKQGRCEKEERECFRMPLHYPKHTRADYEAMPEWRLDLLLKEYGQPVAGDADQKRQQAIGSFIWEPN